MSKGWLQGPQGQSIERHTEKTTMGGGGSAGLGTRLKNLFRNQIRAAQPN